MEQICQSSYTEPIAELTDLFPFAKRKGSIRLSSIRRQQNSFEVPLRKRSFQLDVKKPIRHLKSIEQSDLTCGKQSISQQKQSFGIIPQFQFSGQKDTLDNQNQYYSKTLQLQNNNVIARHFKLRKQDSFESAYQLGNAFPTYQSIRFSKHNFSENDRQRSPIMENKRKDNQSRISILMNAEINKSDLLISRKKYKKLEKLTNLSPQIRKKSHSQYSVLSPTKNEITECFNGFSDKEVFINENNVLENLNMLMGTEQKTKSFRISRQKLRQLIREKFGYDAVINFFSTQNNEDLEGIINFCKKLLHVTHKISMLLSFLTFDQNLDGVITQDQIMKLKYLIDSQSPVNNDVSVIISYIRANPNLKCERDLPQDFLRFPTIKKFREFQKGIAPINPKDEAKKGVLRFFSLKIDQDEDEEQIQLDSFKRKNSSDIPSKKNIQINFEHFQKAFEFAKVIRPSILNEIACFILGSEYNKIDDLRKSEQPKRKMTINYSLPKKSIKLNSSLGNSIDIERDENSLSKAQEMLKMLHSDKKKIFKVKFDQN